MEGLYHYTSKMHLPLILKSSYLSRTQGILDDRVVWLTASDNASGNGLEGSCVDKSEIRFTLKNIPAIQWKDYKEKVVKGEDKEHMQAWCDALELDQNPNSWWIYYKTIIPLQLVETIENTKTGEKVTLDETRFIKSGLRLKKQEIRNIIEQLS